MPSPKLNPELMVIGDSLAQGCHSLSVTKTFCEMSYAAQVASVLNWQFRKPSLPQPVLFDLEEIVRYYLDLWRLEDLLNYLQSNLESWRKYFRESHTDGPEYFDNLAVAGASINETRSLTYTNTLAVLKKYQDFSFHDPEKINGGTVSDLHVAINSGFVLNPRGKDDYAGFNMLDWVKLRQPKRLVIHAGHNDGLYKIGGDAVPEEDLLQVTAERYVELIDDIEKVTKPDQLLIFILLPKISAAANLAVSGHGPNREGYWEKYAPVFSLSNRSFTATEMQSQDAAVVSANETIRRRLDVLKESRKVEVINAYDLFDRWDYKNYRVPDDQVVIDGRRFDNRYIEGIGPYFLLGGLQSIDGMHPTNIGYGLLAIELLRALKKDNPEQLLHDALVKEDLIMKFPSALEIVVYLLGLVRHLSRDEHGRALRPQEQSIFLEWANLLDSFRWTAKIPSRDKKPM
jgi:lysophospholipase L1-like esterase